VASQAFWSHGQGLWHAWRNAHKVDWISVTVFLYLPVLLAAALWNAWQPAKKRIGE